MENSSSIYYSINDLLSHNALFSFVVGERGTGKTFQFKEWAIRDFIKNKNQFVYVRRYKTEFKDITNFFDDIMFKFPNHKFEIKGGKFYIDDEIAGFYIALSTAITKKSVAYPSVTKIGFDEFILEKSTIHYLPNEINAFLGLYETIARDRDVRCVFMANSVTILNPYFLFFGINPNREKRFSKYKNNEIVVELTDLQEFKKHKKETRFGQIIEGTDFAKYSIENEFVDDNYEFIEQKTKNCYYLATFYFKKSIIGLWCDNKTGIVYASNKYDETYPIKYSLTTEDHKPNMMMLSNAISSSRVRAIRKCYEFGSMRFESLQIKNTMFEIFRILSIAKFSK